MVTPAFAAGARAGLEKTATSPASGLAALTKARQRTPAASVVAGRKGSVKKPSRELGMGEQTMSMADVKAPTQKLQQPAKPIRY